jgi:aminoglycoside 3-N-acetyltransferase I
MVDIRRLGPGDEAVALEMFEMMTAVFGEGDDERGGGEPLREEDVAALLSRKEFWAISATAGSVVVGGLTAHALPMTRSRSTELFIYDLAVSSERQRRGIGRALVAELLSLARSAGTDTVFVPAENEDTHALAFYSAVGGVPSPVTFFTLSSRADQLDAE